ncbi:unnamed protein product [Allacma fusca]|uniref:Uncharacterized protein n=1 Tax=Allacma fusca TaxID=39272 RepID=A0A8J2NL06_9HEXA|nr:unnamed protein product [Allacma fusca]
MGKLLYIYSFFLAILNIPGLLGAPSEPELFLTKYIKDGQLDKARELSSDHMKQFHLKSSTSDKLQSFSGYLTVDEAVNSNIFFWFFPALENPATAPVVMWMSENTGFSCLKGVFLETGPFYLDENLELKDRNHSWVQTHSMLYIDAPVGVGFSFTEKEEGYARNTQEESAEVYEALTQFFTLFSDYAKNDFYLAGELAAADHAPRIVSVIHDSNEKGPKVKINLKGMMFGSPIFNMPVQLHFGKYFYNMGLINEEQRDMIITEEEKVLALIKEKKFKEAHDVIIKIVFYPNNMYQRFSGLESSLNILATKPPKEIGRFAKFMDSNEVHNYLHVGLHKFSLINWKVHDQFNDEIMTFDGSSLESIMDKGYKVLIFSGQFDPVAVPPGVKNAVEALKWKGAEDFKKAPRTIWKVKDEVAGYARSFGDLTYVLVRNSGRYVMMDNPEWGYELANHFTSGKSFDT